jgi:hypothetical protein
MLCRSTCAPSAPELEPISNPVVRGTHGSACRGLDSNPPARAASPPMNPTDAKLRFAQDKRWAETAIVKDGRLTPLLVVVGDEPAVLPMDALGSRAFAWQAARLVAIAHNAQAVAVIGEAWTVSRRLAERGLAEIKPSQSDWRIECVTVTLHYRHAGRVHLLSSIRAIVRDATGTITGLGREQITGSTQPREAGGSFADVLPERAPSATERAAARELVARAGIIARPLSN